MQQTAAFRLLQQLVEVIVYNDFYKSLYGSRNYKYVYIKLCI